ncbi:MAG: hypothetical protein IJT36_03455 [Alphaproteobacteria bacterium]|nr:hypothetical protein [Alphaproteobacteria bacterium]
MNKVHRELSFVINAIDILSEPCDKKVKKLRIAALQELDKQISSYLYLGYSDKLITAIMKKKTAMIRNINTKKECEALMKPHAPHYDGVKFIPDKFWIPEEELIGWSQASLKAPLNHIGYKRYAEVFKMVFPERYEEIFGGRI